MYISINFKTKKAFEDAAASGQKITLYAPGIGAPKQNGVEYVEGPHYPEPHRWYVTGFMKDGYVVKVQ